MPRLGTISPLFRTAARAMQAEAAREFQKSEFGRIVREVRRGSATPAAIRRLSQLQSGGVQRFAKQFMGQPFGQTVRTLEQYAKRGGASASMVDDLLGSLGQTGTLIRSLFGTSGGLKGSIRAAASLLRAFGGEAILPEGMGDLTDWDRGIAAMKARLEAIGYTVLPPGEAAPEVTGRGLPTERTAAKTKLPFGTPETTRRGKPRRVVDVQTVRGRRRFKVDHPAITGEMVPCQSSNVHSYGYDVEHGLLYVRFLDSLPGGARAGPGPLYQYSGVDAEEFDALHRAGSKGDWVWDHLRIRGTVSGHRKDYRLVGVVRGYVPRKATLDPAYGGEVYIKRRVLTNKGRWLESQRPSGSAPGGATIAKAGTAGMRPNRGAPNRGRPAPVNRGR